MKILAPILGIVSFGLTVWPIAFSEWFWHAHPQGLRGFPENDVVGLMLFSLLAGLIIAICGKKISDHEAASMLQFIGETLCTLTFYIDGAIVVWIIYGISQFSHFGVN
jgi:hypothetical protein